MNRVQIAVKEREADRWRFLAHGAAYDMAEAKDIQRRMKARGALVQFLPI